MEKSELKGLFANGRIPAGVEYKSALTDILQTFPYFQLAQVFFAKQLYDAREPEASGRIKLASVYAPDRKAMYILFKTAAPDRDSQSTPNSYKPDVQPPKNFGETEVKYNFIYSSSTAKKIETTDNQQKNESEPALSLQKELTRTETFIRRELEIRAEPQNPAKKPIDRDIEKTEIAKPETNSIPPAKKFYAPPTIEKKEEQAIVKAASPLPVEEKPSDTDIKAKEKKSTIIIQENAATRENRKEETKIKVNEPIADSRLKYSFSSWLKVLPEISIEQKPLHRQDTSDIIDSFLKNSPSISRPKAEFFSPVKAAKMSLTEDDTIVSETLAKIYLTQGNLQKALKAYETLLLQFPEKKNIFAARFEEIKALIRANTKPATK